MQERIKTGIKGLDDMLGGGFLPQTANLVEGAPGTGKTTLGVQFLYSGITQFGEPGLILTFEQDTQQYFHDAANFGWDFKRLQRDGLVRVIRTSPEVTLADLEHVGGQIEGAAKQIGARRILVDSLSHFERLATDPVTYRRLAYSFINGLKREGLTSVLTRESTAFLGEPRDEEEDVAFVVDSYLLMRYVEIKSAIHRALLVLKMRGSDHAKDIRQYEITETGIVVRDKFEGQEGIMSGTPRSPADFFDAAFLRRRR
jgi:circadian clock protein KaiC